MKKIIYLIALVFGSSLGLQAQSCASLYGSGPYQFTTVCTPSGVTSYQITVTGLTGNTFTISGFRNESQGTVTATCAGANFSFPMTLLPSGNSIVGTGSWTGSGPINVALGVYDAGMQQIDTCVGTYNVPVGIEDANPAFSVNLLPNPAQSQVQVRVDGLSGLDAWQYQVYDMGGRKLMTGEVAQAASVDLALDQLPQGLYQVLVRAGDHMHVKALLKQ